MITRGTEHLTSDEFAVLLRNTNVGDIIRYAVGELARDCELAKGDDGRELRKLRELAQQGKCCLAQRAIEYPLTKEGTRRITPRKFAYLAIRCNHPHKQHRSIDYRELGEPAAPKKQKKEKLEFVG